MVFTVNKETSFYNILWYMFVYETESTTSCQYIETKILTSCYYRNKGEMEHIYIYIYIAGFRLWKYAATYVLWVSPHDWVTKNAWPQHWKVFSNQNTECICEQQRGASMQTGTTLVYFYHWWLELAFTKSQEVFIVLITHWNVSLDALPVSE